MKHLVLAATLAGLASALPFAAHGQAAPERWVEVNRNDRVVQSVDPRTITRSGNTVRIWQRSAYSAPEDGISVSLFLNEYDCERRTFQLVAWTDEDSNGRRIDGGTIERGEQEVHPVVPDSFGEAIFDDVCRR